MEVKADRDDLLEWKMANGSNVKFVGGTAEKLISYMNVDCGEVGCSFCYDGGCADPLGCGETDRKGAE